MFHLARELAASGQAVLTTTTTKIFWPAEEQSPFVIISSDPQEVIRKASPLIREHRHLTAGKKFLPDKNKIAGFDSTEIQTLLDSGLFQWIINEADGAAERPLKAPADHEPVIPGCTSHVVAVVGLDAVGRPLNDRWIFRAELYSEMTGLPMGSPVSELSVARVIMHERGLMKGSPFSAGRYVFLNKAETEEAWAAARRIGAALYHQGGRRIEKLLIGAVKSQPLSVKQYDPVADVLPMDEVVNKERNRV
jgi:probable selenium-dependent hydroxylase accessory protein YqeC